MKKTLNINLSGRVFYIDDDAFARLREYLDKLERYFKKQDEGQEIINDIESRIAELLGDRISEKSGVVTMDMVDEIIAKMGQPEEFDDEGEEFKERKESKQEYAKYTYGKANKRLFRDIDSRVLGGVCGGIAAYLNIDPVLVRILFVLFIFLGLGMTIPIYIILWIVVPAAITTAQKLEMRGENVTISNIEKAIRNEYEDVKQRFSKVRNTNAYRKGETWWSKFTKRDKTIISIIAIVGAFFFLGGLADINWYHQDFVHHVNFQLGHMPFFHFPGFLVTIFVLLIIGLIFKSLFKIIIYFIAFMFLAIIGLKVVGFLMGSVFMLC
ncbi:PspC domain-containing protein [Labilibacter marinus]|uniref:PspC domain-containing protein n=1 Tax=Labilibacter marinus TaxID=1477105 RepID=UPI00082DF0CB|nr:PspC domain-containing protein [Labilibacter marinus]